MITKMHLYMNELLGSLPSKGTNVVIVDDNARIETARVSRSSSVRKESLSDQRWLLMSSGRSSSDSCLAIPQRKSFPSDCLALSEHGALPSGPMHHAPSSNPQEPAGGTTTSQDEEFVRWSPHGASSRGTSIRDYNTSGTNKGLYGGDIEMQVSRSSDSALRIPMRWLQSPHITKEYKKKCKKGLSELDDSTHLARMDRLKVPIVKEKAGIQPSSIVCL
jgi:hypothetical protein